MDKTTLCYCTPNLHKLARQAPLCGWVLASSSSSNNNNNNNNSNNNNNKSEPIHFSMRKVWYYLIYHSRGKLEMI